MAGQIQCGRRVRRDFGKIASIVEIPNLIEIQRNSYEAFLQKDYSPEHREDMGLQAVFKSVFPISDYNENASLEFVGYHFGDPKYTVEECHDRGMTHAIPLKVTLRLVVYEQDKSARHRAVKDIKEQEVYLGELPLMTEKGTFIINGTERVVVSQLQRSAGVFFDDDRGKTLASGKKIFSARIIPYRGSWVEFEFDANDILQVRIDRRRKMLRDRVPARLQVPRDLRQRQAEGRRPLGRGDPRHLLRPRGGRRLRGRRGRRQAEPGDPPARDAGRRGRQAAPAS